MEKLMPKIFNSESGYCIVSPVYAGKDGDYLSHWQQASPYYFRVGNLFNWVEKSNYSKDIKLSLSRSIAKIYIKKQK